MRRHEAPEEVPEATFSAANGLVYLPGTLQAVFGNTTSHWRRQIDQGGVRIDGEPAGAYEVDAAALDGAVVQAGKRHFVRLRPA